MLGYEVAVGMSQPSAKRGKTNGEGCTEFVVGIVLLLVHWLAGNCCRYCSFTCTYLACTTRGGIRIGAV